MTTKSRKTNTPSAKTKTKSKSAAAPKPERKPPRPAATPPGSASRMRSQTGSSNSWTRASCPPGRRAGATPRAEIPSTPSP